MSELRDKLKAKANLYGLTYAANATDETIADKINKFEAELKEKGDNDQKEVFDRAHKNEDGSMSSAGLMVKCHVTNLNKDEGEVPTVFVAVGNAEDDFYEARYVPFGEDWFVPWALIQDLMGRHMQVHVRGRDKQTGKMTKMKAKQVPHYAIQLL